MRRRTARFAAALTVAVGAGVLTPVVTAAEPTAATAANTEAVTSGVTSGVTETEVVEAIDASNEVVQSTTTQYRVVSTTSCRRTKTGRVCEDAKIRVAVPTETTPSTDTARGSATSYAFLAKDSKGRPAHWNRCSTIRYRVNTAALTSSARSAALTEVKTAMSKLASAHGLKVSYVGTTSVVPYATTDWASKIPSTQPAEIYVAWSNEKKVPALKGTVAGIGGPAFQQSGTREPRIVRGAATLDIAARVAPGFGPGTSRGALLLHELGHAANLGHVEDRYQTMYPSVNSDSRGDYQVGDRAGLTKLASYACF